MLKEDIDRLVAVMRSYERKTGLSHYDMWGKTTRSHGFKVEEFRLLSGEISVANRSGMLALDAGCGYGVYSSMLSEKGYGVVALDASVGMLRKARHLTSGSDVSFVRGSITHLPLRSDEFALLLCVDTLHHFTDSFLNKTLDEFRRVIKSGGSLIIDTRNALNPLVSLQYWIKNRKWSEVGGLTLKARSLRTIKKSMRQYHFRIDKAKGIGFAVRVLAPYVVVFSKASETK